MSRRKLSEISRETEARLGAKRIVENEIARLTVRLRQFENETIDALSSEVGIRESVTILQLCSQSVSDEDYRDPSAYAYALEMLAEGVHGIRTTLHDAGHLSAGEDGEDGGSPPVSDATAASVDASTSGMVVPVQVAPVRFPPATALVPASHLTQTASPPADTSHEPAETTVRDEGAPARTARRLAEPETSTFVLHGIVIATQHRDKVDEIVDQAIRDRAVGEKDPQFDNARGKNIWRKRLYDAVFDDAEPVNAGSSPAPSEERVEIPASPPATTQPATDDSPEDATEDVPAVTPSRAPAPFVLSPVAGTDLPLYPRTENARVIPDTSEDLPVSVVEESIASEQEQPRDEVREGAVPTPASTDPPARPKAELPAFLMAQPRPARDDWTDPYGAAKERAATQPKEDPRRPNFGLKFPGVKELDLSHLK